MQGKWARANAMARIGTGYLGLAFVAVLPLVGAADAATRVWPSDCGCASSLQGCIDFASAGDEVRIDTEVVIDEDLTVASR